MRLVSFGYKEAGWELRDLSTLNTINLLVGRNATGKTRTIKALGNITSFLQMRTTATWSPVFETALSFASDNDADWKMDYSFKVNNGLIEKESLIVNGNQIIKRTKISTRYKSQVINPPADKLVVQVRRDMEQYPEIESLMNWAEGVVSISCSDISPYSDRVAGISSNPFTFSELVEKLSDSEKQNVIVLASNLGYRISNIKMIEASGIKLVKLRESSVSGEMIDAQLSSGMLRTLYLLCFVSIVKQYRQVSMLLIDDMSEGLDYRRSVDLGKIIFDYCAENGMQIIASSNDSFLMDVVDISNWQVLRREGGKVSSVNQSNSPDLFRKFRMTGLSNFDFFSSDFIDSYINK